MVTRWHRITLVQSVYQFLESLVANSANRARLLLGRLWWHLLFLYVFESWVGRGLHYKESLIDDCVAVEEVERTFHCFLFLYCLVIDHFVLAFEMIEQIGRIALWCRHHRVTNLAQYLFLFRVRLLETKVFPHSRFVFTFLDDQRLSLSHLGSSWTKHACHSLAESEFGYLRRGRDESAPM